MTCDELEKVTENLFQLFFIYDTPRKTHTFAPAITIQA